MEQNKSDEDLSLPKATVFKLVQEMLPEDISCGKGTRELLIELCVEFIHLIASQSTEICEEERKKTIGGEHVISALEKLGFSAYIPEVKREFEELKQSQKEREKKVNKLETSGLSEEELLRQQEELFNQARLKYQEALRSPVNAGATVSPAFDPLEDNGAAASGSASASAPPVVKQEEDEDETMMAG